MNKEIRNAKISRNVNKVIPITLFDRFIATSTKTDEDILEFSKKNSLFFIVSNEKYCTFFREQHSQISSIYRRAITDKIDQTDLAIINKQLEQKHEFLRFEKGTTLVNVTNIQMDRANNDLTGTNAIKYDRLIVKSHSSGNPLMLFWDALVLRLTSDSFKSCINCGKFFRPTRSTGKYCSDSCKTLYNRRKALRTRKSLR